MEIPTNYWINQNKVLPKEEIALRLTEAYARQQSGMGYRYFYDAYEYFMTKLKEEK